MRLTLPLCLFLLLTGCGMPSFLVTPVSGTYELQQYPVERGHGGKIALISVEGMLIDVRSGGLLAPEENPLSLFIQELNSAADDDSVKAVVLRINSPGGSVTTSDVMYDALLRFRAKTHKPVIASAQEVAASGAYYLSCGCNKIVANPTSLVGSIGVIFETFDVTDTMEKIGVRSEAIKSAELKDMGSPFKHLTPHEREIMQSMVDDFFARFKSIVTANRPIKTPDALAKVTDGRVFSGDRALELGLIDQVGRLNDAIDLARQMAHVPKAEVVMYKRPYGYTGSIYATAPIPEPQANVTNIKLPFANSAFLPTGFYYLWQP